MVVLEVTVIEAKELEAKDADGQFSHATRNPLILNFVNSKIRNLRITTNFKILKRKRAFKIAQMRAVPHCQRT